MAKFYGNIKRFEKQNPTQEDTLNSHRGVTGESRVNEQLSRLDDNYHIFLGVVIPASGLEKKWLDTIVVSENGLFALEIKNWSPANKSISADEPYKQAQDNGEILRESLIYNVSGQISVTKVLVSAHEDSFQFRHGFDYGFPHVFGTTIAENSSNNITAFIQSVHPKQVPGLTKEQVTEIVKILETLSK